MVIYLWIAKNNDQICNSGLFLQNALVEYIGVYSDTNDTCSTFKDDYFISSHTKSLHHWSLFRIVTEQSEHVFFLNLLSQSTLLLCITITLALNDPFTFSDCHCDIAIAKIKWVSLADLEGACDLGTLRVPILSYQHTKFSKCTRLRSPRPTMRSTPPYGKSWIRHWVWKPIQQLSVADPGFSIGECRHLIGGVHSRGGYISKILYVETKESGPLGGVRLVQPMIAIVTSQCQ